MGMHQRFASLSLQAYIYRYHIVGGALSFYALPDLLRYQKFQREEMRPWLNEMAELQRSGKFVPYRQ